MRSIVWSEYISLDGVVEEPGDWSIPYFSDDLAQSKSDELFESDALLLRRSTYEAFAATWPNMEDVEGDFAVRMNTLPKYIALDDPHEGRVEQLDGHPRQHPGGGLKAQAGTRQEHPDRWQRRARELAHAPQPDRRDSDVGPSGRSGKRQAPLRGRKGVDRPEARRYTGIRVWRGRAHVPGWRVNGPASVMTTEAPRLRDRTSTAPSSRARLPRAAFREPNLFVGPPRAQATTDNFSWPELVAVTDLASAQRAVDTILEQGEGARGHWEQSHFGQFVEILDECRRRSPCRS
jgi:Ferritin-like